MTRLRKMMLEELQRRNYAEATIRHYIRTVEDFARRFSCPPDRLGPRHIREFQAELFQKRKLSPNSVGGSPILLHQDAEEGVEHCRDSLSEMGISPTNDPQPGRSCATHRRSSDSLPSDPVDDTLCHWSTAC